MFSLSDRRKLSEEGAHFRSHIDGSRHLFTPENVVDTQRIIGSDIMMALDECTPGDADFNYARRSLSLDVVHNFDHFVHHFGGFSDGQPAYGIAFGAEVGHMVCGLATQFGIGASLHDGEERLAVAVERLCFAEVLPSAFQPALCETEGRYLMGVGTPANILEAIDRGVDMMDCVMPTRNARNGMLFTAHGTMNMRNRKWADDFSPLQEDGPAEVDRVYTKAYVRHLFIADELLAMQIASIHNLAFYLWLVGEARKHITAGDFPTWKRDMLERVQRRL